MFDGLIGRVPIYTGTFDVFGYELSVCSGEALSTGTKDSEDQWAETVRQAGQTVDLKDLVGDGRAMLRVPFAFLSVCERLAWPKSQMVVAVSGDVLNDNTAQQAVARLAEEGFTIALHNPSCDLAELRHTAGFASICSLDARRLNDFKARWTANPGRALRLLVRDVETPEQYDRFASWLDYYEGVFSNVPDRYTAATYRKSPGRARVAGPTPRSECRDRRGRGDHAT